MILKRINFILFFFISISILLLQSCGLPVKLLKDGRTEVPLDSNLLSSNFRIQSLELEDRIIDCSDSIYYEEFNISKQIFEKYENQDIYSKAYYQIIKFCSNGHFNHYLKEKSKMLDSNSFDTEFEGQRGMYVIQNNVINLTKFAAINLSYDLGKIELSGYLINDILAIKWKDKSGVIYFKRKTIPKELRKNFKMW